MQTVYRNHVYSGLILTIHLCLFASVALAQSANEKRVEVAGHGFHVLETGTGKPSVVFENGMGEDLSTWKDVQPAIAKLTDTFSYDRAGLGKSDQAASSEPRDAKQLAIELHTLLHAAQVPGPYVLVGHSLGGAIVQVFAFEYPAEVAGLVLVDPGDGRLDKLLSSKLPHDIWLARQKALAEEMPTLPRNGKREYVGLAASGDEAAASISSALDSHGPAHRNQEEPAISGESPGTGSETGTAQPTSGSDTEHGARPGSGV